jgi:hypothetical protein
VVSSIVTRNSRARNDWIVAVAPDLARTGEDGNRVGSNWFVLMLIEVEPS